jgi:hypothetical protein
MEIERFSANRLYVAGYNQIVVLIFVINLFNILTPAFINFSVPLKPLA